jgi:hypothetical protein
MSLCDRCKNKVNRTNACGEDFGLYCAAKDWDSSVMKFVNLCGSFASCDVRRTSIDISKISEKFFDICPWATFDVHGDSYGMIFRIHVCDYNRDVPFFDLDAENFCEGPEKFIVDELVRNAIDMKMAQEFGGEQ